MQINKQHLFPTPIYTLTDVLEPKERDGLAEWMPTVMSRSDLELDPRTAQLMQQIERMVDSITQDLKYAPMEYTCTGMWANENHKGHGHLAHTHSNNWLSGVYYPHDSDTALEFWDPRSAATVLQPKIEEFTRENSKTWQHAPRANTMIVFPSWLQHSVPNNTQSRPRLSMAFNIMMCGLVGDKDDKQQGDFGQFIG
jgi:uncharacterized protein (TIGR02466 family)